ncbi:MAG TPA: DUF4080 domain-containing protein, partial [Myxococcota bacterium]|nr:DUF4080 domain-containing protein [Myxococcota bacterium]
MTDIVLTTFNAKYAHASMGLRCLFASLGELRERAVIDEAICGDRAVEVAEKLLAHAPKIIGIGVYVWNAPASRELVTVLKKIAPEVKVVIGGPEVSHELDLQPIVATADYVVTGEGEEAFAKLCGSILAGEPPSAKTHAGGLPDLATLQLPYAYYDDDDVAHRVIYVEASRGCPFTCEFCLSSLDERVRNVPLERLFPELEKLMARGVDHFKFIDRTFNLKPAVSSAILRFFLERYRPGSFVHFEMVPDRLPDSLRALLAQFPPGAVQLEVGVQTFNDEVAARIGRRQDVAKLEANFRYLRESTGVHLHADLIAGLPGETLESFAAGFDRLLSLDPQEIQVGILKRLRGAPIARHTESHRMVYADEAPYEVLSTDVITFATMQRLKRFAKVWDAIGNSGHFLESRPLLWGDGSPFASVMRLADRAHTELGRTHAVS